MRIGIYSPYLDTAGGGEKYMLTIGECLSGDNEVDIFLDNHLSSFPNDEIKKKNEDLLGLDLSKVRYIKAPFGRGSSSKERYKFLKNYDVIFYNTDGSIFFSSSKKSIIHFQMPLKNSGAKGFLGSLKLKSWKKAIYNSKFTKEYIEKEWDIKGEVVYPPVDVEKIVPRNKENIILSVGRFVKATKVKKHEEMIKAFGELQSKGFKGWSLYLAGGMSEGDSSYLKDLEALALNLPIKFFPNISRDKLYKLYGEASIYWHFMGLGEEDPTRFEHFGITTVEAMAGGCIPIVINKGGQKEIVEDKVSGFLWNTLDELFKRTIEVTKDKNKREELSKGAVKRALKFDKTNFKTSIKEIVNG